ncbi:MAG: 2,3-bisphosphoglycerate-independent phosphoglycerate mutase [Candidatus Gottesmanbacteria bacterium GW2011_GWA1_48_13]|uniref:2,3-bisphosphoglycerate-independent phosphoglycerate mutase n=1 Tax=Candidatus Gottesmanbacteria bacterium GW2011_GWA1_48_13 TaxID=1618439 RepID=A0A0G1UPL5_9BACT|nr:MAG: 2,3-bisphosphoglycerate-independent phosphoglycerate mutase [Candidatus Gottesmanbacteria bacterium GW2011_GWA1_48_13]
MPASVPKPVVLAILDGWGIAPPGPGNAIAAAKTPNMTSLWSAYTHTQLIAHGESVGLPKSEPGNTETGHLNLGAGRIVYQDLPRINMAIADGTFFQDPELMAAITHAKKNSSRMHILGLVGGGGVHSDISHLFALVRLCKEQQVQKLYLHLFTDGRDSPPTAALTYISQVKQIIEREGMGEIATIMGRYFAMDRDFRWDRTAKAYFCLTRGEGKKAKSVDEAISQSYAANKTDEFIEPTIINPEGVIKAGDAAIFYNFRIDRPRQLTKAFVLPNFEETANHVGFDPYAVKYTQKHTTDVSGKPPPFARGPQLANLYFVTMTEYEEHLPAHVAFPPQVIDMPLGRVVSTNQLRQLRLCESEKERFVTYYFNGQREDIFPAEDRQIVPSPKVPTYDKKPEMAALEVTQVAIEKIQSQTYDLIILNFANADMVGHTGNFKATLKACETVDECVGSLSQAVLAVGGVLLITADHGNAEEMINRTTGGVDTEHNSNPVPLIIVGDAYRTANQIPQGILADVSPTILGLLKIPAPSQMTGRNLLR